MGMIIVETDNVFTKEVLEHVQQLTDSLIELDGISSVTSLTNIIDIKGGEDGLEIGNLVDEINEPYDFITANIFSHVVIELLKDIRKVLTVGGILLCSGIIDENRSAVISAMEDTGFEILETAVKEEWVAIAGRLQAEGKEQRAKVMASKAQST